MDQLPIDNYRKEIEDTIAKNPVTILTAETGAGKSTRVPLWMWKKNKVVHVTQPRRIATRSLSLYLAHITNTQLGKEIGYQTGFDSKQSKNTRLLYLTDGVQMIREIKRKRDYDVLLLDEIHEWNLNQEVLVGVVKQNLERGFYRTSGKRVVIMSATLQAQRLSTFLADSPIISVPGRGYPVTLHHNDPRFLLPDTASMVELGCNVLVFQPGKQEIDMFMEELQRLLEAEKHKAKILPLHAELSLNDQAKVFEHYPIPKVIVATDIAQTSLTIDDIDAVVDGGIKKELRLVRGIEGLYPVDISSSECMQRAGRAGRVRPGRYFLCADAGINDRTAFPEPEIQRLNLESVALRLIKMGLAPLDFPFFHSPSKALIFKAIKQLKLLGAIDDNNNVTEDGNKMAELPVSLRCARLLLEAQKGSGETIDNALKCIAVLEAKGIVTKEYTGEKVAHLPYNSDLLNQLLLWQSVRVFKPLISQKKFALAKEVYTELKKRLQLPELKPSHSMKDIDMLFRAVLSSFADEVHVKGGDEYQRDNEIRQLDRTSVLFQSKPELIAGLPFDLIINRENWNSGETEQILLPLITFASEFTLDMLEKLKPFSYSNQIRIYTEQSKIVAYREYFFGGKIIKAFPSSPNWHIPGEKEQAVEEALKWFDQNQERFELSKKLRKVENDFNAAKSIIKGKLKSFDYYRKGFLIRELRANLDMDTLDLFFNFHKGFSRVHLKKLLPFPFIRDMKKARWPEKILLNDETYPIDYIEKKAFVKLDYPVLEKIKEDDLVLPTGETAGVILGEQKISNWELAVFEFNRWKKNDLFEKKYRDLEKTGFMEDLMGIPFPQVFEAGKGKDNTPIEFFIVPKIQGDNAFLAHLFDREEADAYFKSFRSTWEEYIKKYKKTKLEDIFKQKGWKVKG